MMQPREATAQPQQPRTQPREMTAQPQQPITTTLMQPCKMPMKPLGNDDATSTTNHNHKKAMTATTTMQPLKRPLMACDDAITQVDCCPPSKHISLKPLQLYRVVAIMTTTIIHQQQQQMTMTTMMQQHVRHLTMTMTTTATMMLRSIAVRLLLLSLSLSPMLSFVFLVLPSFSRCQC